MIGFLSGVPIGFLSGSDQANISISFNFRQNKPRYPCLKSLFQHQNGHCKQSPVLGARGVLQYDI